MHLRNRSTHLATLVATLIALCLVLPGRAETVEDSYKKLKFAFEIELEKVDRDIEEKLAALRENYSGALAKLEAKLQSAGDLDGLLAVRAEVKSIAENGAPDKKVKLKSVTGLRELYITAGREIETERGTSRQQTVQQYRERLQTFVKRFTKDGEIDRALAVEKEMKELDKVAAAGDSETTATTDTVRLMKIPTTRPAVLNDPLKQPKWSNEITFPAGRYEFTKNRGFSTHGGGGTLYLSRGGILTSENKTGIHVWGGRLVAEGCQFRGMRLKADHSGAMYFVDCKFSESTIQEQGTWYGYGNYDAPFYFENCTIEKRFTSGDQINIFYWGLCMSRCDVVDVDLPAIKFKGEPAARRKDKWLRVNRCHFKNCRVPLSFLMITNDCLFTDCRFEDDKGAEAGYKSPFTVTYYTRGCTSNIYKKPDVVTLKDLSSTKLQTPVGKL